MNRSSNDARELGLGNNRQIHADTTNAVISNVMLLHQIPRLIIAIVSYQVVHPSLQSMHWPPT